jgi:hypothetical protein
VRCHDDLQAAIATELGQPVADLNLQQKRKMMQQAERQRARR